MKKPTLRSLDSRALDKRRPSRGSSSPQGLSTESCGKDANAVDSKRSIATGFLCIAPDVKVGENVKFSQFINLYGCEVGDETKIGAFVEIQKNAKIGRRCKISSHTFICEGVTIEDEVFVGHNVTF